MPQPGPRGGGGGGGPEEGGGRGGVRGFGGMPGVFGKAQRRRKFAQQGCGFPEGAAAEWGALAGECARAGGAAAGPGVAEAAAGLAGLPALDSTFAERKALRGALEALERGGSGAGGAGTQGSDPELRARVVRALAGVAFCANSRPLHKQLLAALGRSDQAEAAGSLALGFEKALADFATDWERFLGLDSGGFASWRGAAAPTTAAGAGTGGVGIDLCERSLALSHVVVSVLDEGAFRELLAADARRAAGCASVLGAALLETARRSRAGEHVHPGLVNLCQDACTALYSLMQASENGRAWCSSETGSESPASLRLLAVATAEASGVTLLARDNQVTAAIVLWRLHLAEAAGDPAREAGLIRSVYFDADTKVCPAPCATAVDAALAEAAAAATTRGGGEGRATCMREFVLGLRGVDSLCCLRGCLAAAPLDALGYPLPALNGTSGQAWNLLLDGMLPHICSLIENPVDTHFKFQAFHALQGCLHQMFRVLQRGPHDLACSPVGKQAEARPLPVLPKASADRLLSLILSSWEDPLTQTVKLVHSTFEKTLDLSELQQELGLSPSGTGLARAVAEVLLRMGPRRKGRYVPLGAIARRVGARHLLDQQPALLRDSLSAMNEEVFNTPVSSFLTDFLAKLREEEGSTEQWMACWAGDMLQVLLQGRNPALRTSVMTYALPAAVRVDPACFPELVGRAVERVEGGGGERGASGEVAGPGAVAGLVCLLKAGAKLGLLPGGAGEKGRGKPKGSEKNEGVLDPAAVPQSILRSALVSSDAALRIDTFELLAVSRKPTQPPTEEEFAVLREALVLQFKCSAPGERSNWVLLLRKFMHNLSCAHQSTQCRRSGDSLRVEAFMVWLVSQLIAGCYPGSPYARKRFCIQVLNCTLKAWPGAGGALALKDGTAGGGRGVPTQDMQPLQPQKGRMGMAQSQLSVPLLTNPATVRALLAAVVDTWDDIRGVAAEVVLQLPSPLPGITAPEDLCLLLKWSLSLIRSPRVRETDPGSALLRVIMRKYVLGLHWRVSLHPVSAALPAASEKGSTSRWEAICSVFSSALDLLEHCLERAEVDLYVACRSGLAHGVLLALRCLVEDIPWADGVQQGHVDELRGLCERLREGLLRATRVAMWAVVQQDELNHAASEADLIDGALLPEAEGAEDAAQDTDATLGTKTQVILTGCWITVKEVSLLSGALGRHVPLPGGQSPSTGQSVPPDGEVLRPADVQALARNSLDIMLKVKHNGTVEKSRFGATELVAGLLRSSEPDLSAIPAAWIQALVERATQPGQTLNDISRRSSGLPFLLSAVAHGEPHGVPRRLLSQGMRNLLDIAAGGPEGDTGKDDLRPAPRVQALHILFRNFMDADLSLDSSPFYEEGVELAVRLFKDGHWAVRNAASQLFSALVIRTLGFKNAGSRASIRKGLTTVEFFRRYPRLLPFLRAELHVASQKLLEEKALEESGAGGMSVKAAAAVNASLYPILALLSRLRPGIHETAAAASSEKDTTSDGVSSPPQNSPASLLLAVRECGRVARTHSTRSLAAKALAPLVPPSEVTDMLTCTFSDLSEALYCTESGRRVADSNAWSGLLLQAQAILRSFRAEITDQAARSDVLAAVLGRVKAFFFIIEDGGLLGACYQVRTEFTGVVELLRSLAPKPRAWDMATAEFFSEAEAIYDRAVLNYTEDPDGPGRSIFLKKATYLLSALWAGDQVGSPSGVSSDASPADGFEALVAKSTRALLSPLPLPWEVQAGLLKNLLKQRATLHLSPSNARVLAVALAELLIRSDLHFKVEQRALQVMCGLFPSLASERGEAQLGDIVASLWSAVQPILQNSSHFKTQDACTVCTAHIVSLMIESSDGRAAKVLDEAVEDFVAAAEAGSAPHSRGSLREATAQALVGTPLLRRASDGAGPVRKTAALRMWRTIITLLEDENGDVREIVGSHLTATMSERLGVPSFKAGLQTSALLPCCFRAMTAIFGDMEEYHTYLFEVTYSSREMREALRGQLGTGSDRRLFERETDNNFAEPLLLAHLACSQLAQLVDSGCLPAVGPSELGILSDDLEYLLAQELGSADAMVEGGSRLSAGWLGHPTESPEAFSGLLRLVLASKVFLSVDFGAHNSESGAERILQARERLARLHSRLQDALAHPVLLDSFAGGPCDLGALFRAGPPSPTVAID